jgi:Protein of unknown function (DUF2905)
MINAGKMLVLIGLVLAVVGAAVWGLGRAGFRGLPGDVRYESGNVRFYFPVVSCVVLSVILTALVWLVQWMGRR